MAARPAQMNVETGRALVNQWRTSALGGGLTQEGTGAGGASGPVARMAVPLSHFQQRIWFLEQLNPASSAHTACFCAWLDGPVDETLLADSFHDLVTRHDMLTATVEMADGEPALAFGRGEPAEITARSLLSLPERQRAGAAIRLANEQLRQPFNLATGPLVRVGLLRVAQQRRLLVVTAHHIICDGWSLGVALRDLSAAYQARLRGANGAALPGPAARYADVAAQERARGQAAAWDGDLGYWAGQLASVPALDLPSDRPRPTVRSPRGGRCEFVIRAGLVGPLRRLARAEHMSLYMVLLAAFQVFLSRLTGQDDVAVGSPVAIRAIAASQQVIGPLVNTVVLRTGLSGDPPFRTVLARVRQVCLGAYAHQDVPFDKVVDALRPKRTSAHQPLFQAGFALQTMRLPATLFGAVAVRRVELEPAAVQYDLDLELWEDGERLTGTLGYSADLFDRPTIRRMIGQFQTLLAGICAEPGLTVSRLPLLAPGERHRITGDWNDTAVPLPAGLLHEMFDDQVTRVGPAPAVIGEDGGVITYSELAARAGQLAGRLASLGVTRGSLVGIYLPRSPLMVVAVLAILKAGAAYLPLDPDHPRGRLAFMLGDARPAAIVTVSELAGCLPDQGPKIVRMDVGTGRVPAPPPRVGLCGDDAAYVIYTSGSTGVPKGVVISHAGMKNRVLWTVNRHRLGAADRVAQKTALTFDAAGWEVLAPLVCGGAVVVFGPEAQHDPAALIDTVAARGVTVLQFVPSLFRLVAEHPRLEECGSLRLVFCAGEPLPSRLCDNFHARLPAAELHNTYGPTECSIDVTWYPCRPGIPAPIVPIGRPIANTRCYILDRHGTPVPAGVRGELHIGGAGLARGYLNRPALTAEWFVPDPFSGQAGARLYRTGDLARFQRDGTIEFLGRTDHQVKIRGFRIELGEIEHALSQHPAVREAVVVARHGDGPDDPEDLRLVAYLVCAADPPSASELRAHLRRTLPGYMIPAIFVHLDALPLNASGKVDRRALPPPGTSRPTLGEPYVPPRGPLEKQLADIWAELLGVQGIGVYDDFFELGGNSLLGTRVITRLHEVLGVDIPLKLLFQEPTLAALAAAIPGMPGLAAADAAAIPRLPRRPVHQPQPPGPGNRAAAEPAVQDRPGPGSAPC